MKRWILAIVTVATISLMGASSVSAQGYGSRHGGHQAGYGNGYNRMAPT